MPQVRTPDDFSAAITSDLTWRIREISDFRAAVRRMDAAYRPSVLRAGVPLIYAHWEGHVVFVARAYVDFLATRRPTYGTLQSSFRLNEFYGEFRRLSQTELNYQQQINLIKRIASSGTAQFRRVNPEIVSSGSNLKSDILSDLCSYLSIDVNRFSDDFEFIDKILVHRRNNIAHGQFMNVEESTLIDMSDRVIKIMRMFNNAVDNDVILGAYRLPPEVKD
jgi:hypothetical protein